MFKRLLSKVQNMREDHVEEDSHPYTYNKLPHRLDKISAIFLPFLRCLTLNTTPPAESCSAVTRPVLDHRDDQDRSTDSPAENQEKTSKHPAAVIIDSTSHAALRSSQDTFLSIYNTDLSSRPDYFEKRILNNEKAGILDSFPTPSIKLSDMLPKEWKSEIESWTNTFTLEALDATSELYAAIREKFNEYYGENVLRITSIEVVKNPFLYLMYQLKCEELKTVYGNCKEELLFHGTKNENIKSICTKNFAWKQNGRNVGHLFGKGVSFTPRASYATHYTDKFDPPRTNTIILARVAMCNTAVREDSSATLPPEGFDTTANNKGLVYVKYDDNTFFPECLIHYTGKPPKRAKIHHHRYW